MATTGSATLTGRTGASQVFTSIPITSIRRIELDIARSVGRCEFTNASGAQQFVEWDLTLTTTLTDTIATQVHTIVTAGS